MASATPPKNGGTDDYFWEQPAGEAPALNADSGPAPAGKPALPVDWPLLLTALLIGLPLVVLMGMAIVHKWRLSPPGIGSGGPVAPASAEVAKPPEPTSTPGANEKPSFPPPGQKPDDPQPSAVPAIPDRLSLDVGGGHQLVCALIKPGVFKMGSPADEPLRGDDERRREVRLTRPYYMGIYPVTQRQYTEVTDTNPSTFRGLDRPVENVAWHDARAFCQRLSQATGKRVRLPTEAEWEFACRSGTETPFNTGSSISAAMANYNATTTYLRGPEGEFRARTMDVGCFEPNAWGLHDMHGNVQEWCQDWYGPYPADAATDPAGPEEGDRRVLRGGHWRHPPERLRSANREASPPESASRMIGFRVVVDL